MIWHIIGKEVTDYCIDLLNGAHDIVKINQTRFVLIPKVSNPRFMIEFSPIVFITFCIKLQGKC